MTLQTRVRESWRTRVVEPVLSHVPPARYLWFHRRFLTESGWLASAKANAPVDPDGRPVPWYTYAARRFLEPRLRPDMQVFEFGAGHSTLWWAAHVGFVCSVESDARWAARIEPRLPANTDLRLESSEADGEYCRSALARERLFDVLIIDGDDRNNCARQCLSALKPEGVIVWDNADWEEIYADGLTFLADNGFRRLDFTGAGPLNGMGWTTAVLYRPGRNCLGI